MSVGVRYTLGTVGVGALVGLAGSLLVGGEGSVGVAVGAALAVVLQVCIYWGLMVWALPGRTALAHAVGVLIRFVAVGLTALVGVTAMGLPPAPTLLTMVACLFGSTLLEAFFIQRRTPVEVSGDPAAIRT